MFRYAVTFYYIPLYPLFRNAGVIFNLFQMPGKLKDLALRVGHATYNVQMLPHIRLGCQSWEALAVKCDFQGPCTSLDNEK